MDIENEEYKSYNKDTICSLISFVDTEDTHTFYFHTTDISILREETNGRVLMKGETIVTKVGTFEIDQISIELMPQLTDYFPNELLRGRQLPYSVQIFVY